MMRIRIPGSRSMSPTLFEQGVEIMLYGMGTVIAFLTLLVFAMGIMSRVLEHVYPAADGRALPDTDPTPARDISVNAELLAVITAAVHRYRRQSSRPQPEETSHG